MIREGSSIITPVVVADGRLLSGNKDKGMNVALGTLSARLV
ncbi:hypothetical protein HMPREF1981_00539 [Bacteroides pyogenes F0041]|uniref:Uncharacterized protein n=1 Tax=Bacteroides pyogenes F0041 TaxID=1321819 RepID=U2CV57_9BACE|nr:hypothetical protein HMPREF1981_00539 [Bacteroides pyogenes F0041]